MAGVVAALLGNALIAGVLVVLFRVWSATVVEKYKSELQAFNDVQLERLRAELRIAETRGGRFEERQFAALSDIYAAVADATDSFARWTRPFRMSGGPTEEEDWKLAMNAYSELLHSLNQNRLWIGHELAGRVDEIVSQLHEVWAEFVDKEDRRSATWKAVHDVMTTKIPPLRRDFESAAQRLLTSGSAQA